MEISLLDKLALQYKVTHMSSHWAEQNLAVIRTLMERSTVYRRALAPLMIAAGLVGIAASTGACFMKIEATPAFVAYWGAVAVVAQFVCLVLVRRQALKSEEPFWSAPTKRVVQAVLPGYFVGAAAAGMAVAGGDAGPWLLPPVWAAAYGCALHAAGFFMPRGMKLFGWMTILCGGVLLAGMTAYPRFANAEIAHYSMGAVFGVLHLLYGIYLRFTEKENTEA